MWLDCEGALRDLTSEVTVLTYENTSTDILVCQGTITFGNGVNDLDGSGGDFEITVILGSQTLQPDPQLIWFSTATRATIFSAQFPLPVGQTVYFHVKSPNAADTSVWVRACIYSVSEIAKMSYGVSGGGGIINTYEDPGGVYPNG